MIYRYFYLALAASVGMTMASCTDNDYDLSDIDKTVELQVKDLVLPVNIAPVTLGDIISLSEDSKVSIDPLTNQYVFTDDGTFTSTPVKVNGISMTPTGLTPSVTTIYMRDGSGAMTYDIYSDPNTFSYKDDNVSQDIHSIHAIKSTLPVTITVAVDELPQASSAMIFSDLVISLPQGMTLSNLSHGSYDPATGILSIDRAVSDPHTSALLITADMTALDFAGCPQASFDAATHHLLFAGEMTLLSGVLTLDASAISDPLPEMHLRTIFGLGTLEVSAFTGEVSYSYEGFDFSPITLNDLPSILTQEGTDIILDNPQIYITLDNPLAPYSLTGEAMLALTPQRPGETGAVTLESPRFGITASPATTKVCLSPKEPASAPDGYENATHYTFASLSNLLSGNGIPSVIKVNIPLAEASKKEVTDFPIGTNVGAVEGSYTFFAPIALSAGSQVVYSDTSDGWNDEDVDKIVITTLDLTALVTNGAPFDVKLSGYPIGVDGQRIEGVSINEVLVRAGEKDCPIDIKVEGTVRHLDGFRYTATFLSPDGSSQVLSPSDAVNLKDIRVKVSGSYQTEL